ncbi:hypothetical protein GCM10023187_08480 [Nibrella viscosa]|uniref:WD40-like Beta Propeller Repeat n=1 Tax=Nibrella viscosa TaxID=1084524 RepID=A0ABP8JYN2_9BACT
MMMRKLLWMGCLAAFPAFAQTLPVLNQNPTGLRWYKIKTPHFRVLYPEGFDKTAQRTAWRLEQVYEPVSASLNRWPRPISVILQNQSTISNGFVTLTPRRSEFFTTPPQDPFLLGTLDWLDQLAVHEFRHVVQNEKALTGFSKAVYSVMGNAALSALTQGVPDWFFEGDAVGTETVLTRSGRGRIPHFDLGFRTNLLTGRRFTYPKAVGGSYRDNVPNHYVLGYFLTTYLKRTHGVNVWSEVLNRYYRFPLYPFSFSNSLKKITGLRVEELYRRTLTDLNETWRQQQEGLRITPATYYPVHTTRRVFTNYQYPQYLTDSTLLAIKSGLGDIFQIVMLSRNGRERKIVVQGLVNDPEFFSASGGKAAWIEYQYDPRWRQRVYSEIRVLDLATGRLRHLTHRGRYTAAALSPDGRKIVAVRNEEAYTTRLVVLDAETGRELQVIDNPDSMFYQHPRWQDNQTIVVVTLKNGGKTIEVLNTRENTRLALLPVQIENISNPQPWGPYVFYNSPQSGIDNIYAVDTRSGQTFQVTSRPAGAYHAAVSPDGRRVAFHDFTADGHRIAEMPLDPAQWVAAETVRDRPVRYFGPLVAQQPNGQRAVSVLSDSLPAGSPYPSSRYNRLTNAINIYSWGPIVASSGQALTVGVLSQDLLSTTQLAAGYAYNQPEQVGNFYANLSYQGLFPIIDLGFQSGSRNTSIYIDRREPLDSLRTDRWQYNQLTAGLRLPLILTRSKYLQNLTLSANYAYQQVNGYDLPVRYLTEVGFGRSLNTVNYGLAYSRTLRQSKRDVAPRWGQTLSAVWRTTPFGGTLNGELWAVQGSVFLPGLLKHHSIRLRAGYQQQMQGTYRFSPAVFFPRGQSYVSFDQLRIGSAEYRLPLLNPHWAVGRWVYIQRVTAAGFFDAAEGVSKVTQQGRQQTITRQYSTAGLDLTFIFNPLRLRTPLQAGVRSIYNLNTGEWLFQPLIIDIGF